MEWNLKTKVQTQQCLTLLQIKQRGQDIIMEVVMEQAVPAVQIRHDSVLFV
jgi:hypothetical protein